MTVIWDCVSLLLIVLLDVPHLFCRSNTLCPHTSFYHDCWIRRFPGLFLSLPRSEQHGAKVLQQQLEQSAQLCSRKCCDQASCNLAAFYSNTKEGTVNCHLVHCPQPESCILQLQERAVLFTVTAGIDPDLLVFDKLGHFDFNPRSSLKWERPNVSHVLASSADVSPLQDSPNQNTPSSIEPQPQPLPPVQPPPQHSPPMLLSPAEDSPLRSFPPTHFPPLTDPVVSDSTTVSPSCAGTLAQVAISEGSTPSLLPQMDQPMSEALSPAHLDSSKQHINETKGHNGKNQSSEGEVEDTANPWIGLWLLPGLLGSSVAFLCCCSGILALGCCRRRRGRYRPGHRGEEGKQMPIRCTLLKDNV
ncbi:LOW QUALITY PROTEIN: MANSC domain-containing protein 4 [Bombina bombina]|uniref:LOW QUALITY PROTEIN: MANSC domain-containing protein 4 n=1 Tax=Bombina bombina TaxID=8345 RepID=UPI00235A905B|nr:LOW QUALITY PROTEIN: MANSC domain-containing protein 4 [Bombina bombina]